MLRWLSNNALATELWTRWRGEFVGSDGVGNRYYRDRHDRRAGTAERRWVVYGGSGEIEPSAVSPGWHGWLKHSIKEPPTATSLPQKRWEKPWRPNPTGTAGAELPTGHELRGGKRAPATGDYEAWRPE